MRAATEAKPNHWTDLFPVLLALILAIAGASADSTAISSGVWSVAALLVCYAIAVQVKFHRSVKALLCGVVLVATAGFIWHIYTVNLERELRLNYGVLTPSNRIAPENRCASTADTVVYTGANNMAVSRFPFVLVEINGEPVLILDKNQEGDLIIKRLLLNDEDNRNIAKIDDNIFWIDPTVQKILEPGKDILKIYNHSGEEAFRLDYIDKKHIAVSGRFFYHKFLLSIDKGIMSMFLPSGFHLASLRNDCFQDHHISLNSAGLSMMTEGGGTSLMVNPP
jgi:hypothetical protein